jgi:hypothetical protein
MGPQRFLLVGCFDLTLGCSGLHTENLKSFYCRHDHHLDKRICRRVTGNVSKSLGTTKRGTHTNIYIYIYIYNIYYMQQREKKKAKGLKKPLFLWKFGRFFLPTVIFFHTTLSLLCNIKLICKKTHLLSLTPLCIQCSRVSVLRPYQTYQWPKFS